MATKFKRFLVFLLCTMLFYAGHYVTGSAQELQATISGIVTDTSRAAITGASITIHRNDTNTTERTTLTSGDGNFVATNLSPSTYTIIVKAKGFKTFVAEQVTVHVSQKLNLDVMLEVGTVNQSIVVEADAVTLQTESAAQSTTVTGSQVRELELDNRNFQQLVTLQPGVSSTLGDTAGYGLNSNTNISVNGARQTANNWTVDGADINDSGSNGTLLNLPSVDAIQEFTLERSMYDASFGRSAGGQVVVATKSGTDVFHGDLYEFNRNNVFNANSYFDKLTNPVIPRGIERYNNFGFTLGGPLYIPKVYNTSKNKAFFFWSEEWRKVSDPTTVNFPAATPDMLNGLVSGKVANAPAGCTTYNPSANTTQINPACYSKNSSVYLSNILSKYPANNGQNYTFTYSALDNFRQDTGRLDYNVTSKLKFFARYMKDTIPSNEPMGLYSGNNFPGIVNTSLQVPGTNVVGNLLWTISPKMVNELEFAYTEGNIESSLVGSEPANDASLISSLTNNWAFTDPYHRLPSVYIESGIVGVSQSYAPYHETNMDRNAFDNFSLVLNRHTIRAGGTVSWMLKSENAANGTAQFYFNTWSDFLLGNVVNYHQSSPDIVPDLRYTNFEGYVQDDWKLSRQLTLNIGLRYSYFPGPSDADNTMSNFLPSLYDPSAAPVLNPLTGNFVAGQSMIPANYANGLVFPKGTACAHAQAISSQVVCSPYGAAVNPNSNGNVAPRFGFSWGVTANTVLRGGYGIFYDRMLNGMWEQNAFGNPPLVQSAQQQNTSFDNPMQGQSVIPLGPTPLTMTGIPDLKIPSYQSYNLSIQQKLDAGTTFEIAYVGSQQRHLLGEIDLNQPTLAVRQAHPTDNVNAIRPYAGYSYLKDRISVFSGNYNALQTQITHHSPKGLTVSAAYTWSKVLANSPIDRDTAANNTYNLHNEYGPEPFNDPQIFIFNYIYELPFFKEQHGLVGHVLGGWEVSGITTMKSGFSQTVTQSTDSFACTLNPDGSCLAGSPANTYPGGLGMAPIDGSVQIRADQVGPVHLKKSMAQWFDTSSFTRAVGDFGSSHPGSIVGPGQQNWDIGAMKNIRFENRYSFQLRGEFFNAFNHTSPSAVDSVVSDPTFGQVTATHSPRNIQMGGKFYF